MLGFETSDDAAVYQVSSDLAAVLTNDFFTPIVDDPYDFGRIAAANALSDVYAMGAQPLYALSIAALPELLPAEVLARIQAGALRVIKQAGVTLGGGTTLVDQEPKFGLCVLGVAQPSCIWQNRGARPGDMLVLTKPLGTGVITTAVKRGTLDAALLDPVIESMATLNAGAAGAGMDLGVHAATDVTGFGLLGHLHEMAAASQVKAELFPDKIRLFDGVIEAVAQGAYPGQTKKLIRWSTEFLSFTQTDTVVMQGQDLPLNQALAILCDPQTSGGLLVALSPTDANRYVELCGKLGVDWAEVIGTFAPCDTPCEAGTIQLQNGGSHEQ